MAYITDCPLCELRYHREQELVDHLRTDHRGARGEAFADMIESSVKQRRAQRRRNARGMGRTTRA